MDADNTLTRTGEQAVRTPLPGDSGAAPQALAHGTTADGSPDASSGPASQTRPPARTAMADPSGAGVEGPSVRESPGAAASGCPSATDAGTSIRELLDAAHELTRRGNTCHAQAARLTAQAARMAEEQRERSGWGVVAQHALRNAMTGKQAKQAARAGAAGLDLPVVREAQDKGELTVESTDAIMAAARRSDDPEVQQKVVESGVRLAKDQPTGKVKAFAERLVSHLDPAALQKGHAQETEKRNVQLVPKPHGMAKMTAFGPAVELRMVMDGVEAAARKAAEFDKELEVSRTPAQRSFDVFVSMWMPCDQPEERAKSVNQLMARPHMLIHVPAGTLLGASDQPGWLSDDTPIPADVVRRIAKDATWQALVEDAGRVVGLGDRVLAPGTVFGPGAGSAGPIPGSARAAAGPPGALPCPEDWPANTVASDSYQAGAKLRLLLEARDRGCCVPNCSAPPGRCEADHRVPYDPARPAIEQTTGSNMQLLCKAHHQLKTHHGWAHNHDPATGQTTITPPHSPPVAAPPRE